MVHSQKNDKIVMVCSVGVLFFTELVNLNRALYFLHLKGPATFIIKITLVFCYISFSDIIRKLQNSKIKGDPNSSSKYKM